MPPSTQTILERPDALHEIADAIGDRRHFIVLLSPETSPHTPDFIRALPGASCYLDAGLPTVLRMQPPPRALPALLQLLPLRCGVILVAPKTPEGRRRLGRLGSRPGSTADEQDLVLPYHEGEGFAFPLLFVDAVDLVDPVGAAQLRASASEWT